MCPSCRAFITSSDRVCPYCNEPVGPTYVERMPDRKIGGLIPVAQYTTVLILLINAGLFIATQWLSSTIGINMALFAFGGKFGPSIWRDHEWWRLVTAGFLHGGVTHILMNSWALYQLGAQTEELFGTARYLAIYFCATVGGFWLSARMNQGLSIGSSAGIAGLIGAMIAFGVINRSTVGRMIRNFYLQSVVYLIAIGLLPGFNVDNWAHMGGLAAGFAVAYLAGTPIHSTRARESMWRVLAACCVVITAFCFVMVYTHFPALNQLR
jgi:rhomboid protease GluP